MERANYVIDGECADDPPTRTIWIDVAVRNIDDDSDFAGTTVALDPKPPRCDGEDHQWAAPHELLGGCRESPGVSGHGGGVIIREVCRHCGIYRITDTWAQRQDTGEQGLRSTRYLPADDASLAWLDEQRAG